LDTISNVSTIHHSKHAISVPKTDNIDEKESIISLLFKLSQRNETEYKPAVQRVLKLFQVTFHPFLRCCCFYLPFVRPAFQEFDGTIKSLVDSMNAKFEEAQAQDAASAAEKRKRARERQAAILASFQKQQQAFKFLEDAGMYFNTTSFSIAFG